MQSPRDFFKPKAIGAPEPPREIPAKPSRMIHFFDPSNERMAAKVPDIAGQADILLGNLEDAIPTERKVEAREGLVKIARNTDFGTTQRYDHTQRDEVRSAVAVLPLRFEEPLG